MNFPNFIIGVSSDYEIIMVFCSLLLTAAVQENCRVRKDIIAMEKAIAERLGYLQRHKVENVDKCLTLVCVLKSVSFSVSVGQSVRNGNKMCFCVLI